MYWVQHEGAEFLFVHSKTNSVVESSASKSRKHHSTPNDRERKKIDVAGQKFYSTGALGIKTVSYIMCVSHYSYALWEQLSNVMKSLSDNKRTKGHFLQNEGMQLGKQLLTSVKHVLDFLPR